jgi:hypothetical protein
VYFQFNNKEWIPTNLFFTIVKEKKYYFKSVSLDEYHQLKQLENVTSIEEKDLIINDFLIKELLLVILIDNIKLQFIKKFLKTPIPGVGSNLDDTTPMHIIFQRVLKNDMESNEKKAIQVYLLNELMKFNGYIKMNEEEEEEEEKIIEEKCIIY